MTKGSFQCLFGYEPERFSFVENIASIELPVHSINLIQKIVDYFKSWIDNANNQYSVYIRNKKHRNTGKTDSNRKGDRKAETNKRSN